MTTLSTFRINQPPGTPGPAWDRARRDIDLYSVASESVECEATNKAETSYLWEMISAPEGVSVSITNSTTHTCTFDLDTRGSYLIRLTVNDGLVTKSRTTLFIGVALENTGYCLPAMNETNQDNSMSPYDGARGHSDKLLAFLIKVDELIGAGVIRKKAVIDTADPASSPPSASEGDRYILLTGGPLDPGWGSVTAGDIVVYNGATWDGETPEEGWVSYVDAKDVDYRYVDDGSPAWEEVVSGGSLDDAYNLGRQITADAGAVSVTVPDASNNRALELVNNDTTNNTPTLAIENNNAGAAVLFEGSADVTIQASRTMKLASSAGDLQFEDDNKSGWTGELPLSDGSVDWTAYKANLGEVGLLSAINTIFSNAVSSMRKDTVLDIANPAIGPSPASPGDRYILNYGGPLDPGWGAVTPGQIITYNGATWDGETPSEGWIAYVDAQDADYRNVDDGSPAWNVVTEGGTLQNAYDFGGAGAGRQITTDDGAFEATNTTGSNAAIKATNDNTAPGVMVLQLINNNANGSAIHLGGTGKGEIRADNDLVLNSDGGEIVFDDVNKSGWTADLLLSADSADWTNLEAMFGEVSLMNALVQAGTKTKTFDDTITSTSIAGSGGVWDREIDIDIIKSGAVQIVELDISAGTSADTTLELYDADPSGAGVVVYQTQNLDIPTNGKHTDPNIWWTEVAVTGSLWARITNDGASATTYDLRVRMRDDNTTVFTE